VRLLTDPVLRGRVAHLRHEVPAGVDAVLLSHLDSSTSRKITPGTSLSVTLPRQRACRRTTLRS
jgi:hypothetical protein